MQIPHQNRFQHRFRCCVRLLFRDVPLQLMSAEGSFGAFFAFWSAWYVEFRQVSPLIIARVRINDCPRLVVSMVFAIPMDLLRLHLIVAADPPVAFLND